MKTSVICFLVLALSSGQLLAQNDSLGLPGDQLSLYGVLEMFRKSESVEAFEKSLNSGDNHVNNLNLDGDDQVDYIMVTEKVSHDAHVLMLSVQLAEDDIRDIACVAIEKTGPEEAHVQVIGDEEYYGSNYIIEPTSEMKVTGKGSSFMVPVIVNVWIWPSVRWIYRPGYVVWASPWRWMHPPQWWRPWRPLAWTVWRPACRSYVHLHVRVHQVHVVHAHRIYHDNRQKRARADRKIAGTRAADKGKTDNRNIDKGADKKGSGSAEPAREPARGKADSRGGGKSKKSNAGKAPRSGKGNKRG
jgi:hypothetical protein